MQAGGRAALTGGGAVRGRARGRVSAARALGGHRLFHPQHRPGKRVHVGSTGAAGARAREARGRRAGRAPAARAQAATLRAGQLRSAFPAIGAPALHVPADAAHVGSGLAGTYAGNVSTICHLGLLSVGRAYPTPLT